MVTVRAAAKRGYFENSWLQSYHSFSFGDYYDEMQMGYSLLRVMNEDVIAPASGFPTHGHQNMEIVTYLLSGSLEHKDSMGNGSTIYPGEVQRMSAGRGVTHSEYNPSTTDETHLLQIWLLPNQRNIEPGYEQKRFEDEGRNHRWQLLASPTGEEGAVTIYSDTLLYAALLDPKRVLDYSFASDRVGYLQLASGELIVNGEALSAGDGARLSAGERLQLQGGGERAELLLFDLPQ
ncbi:pirin family protein [Ectothiorhodospiraceae bacterium BW-2]|nr:pirin family protein [Ectothiorhodospiraceae bacterium BW-2]